MYVSPISTRLLRGMLPPAIRAMPPLPLPLLVTGVLADHEHPSVATDDLALLAHRLDRGSYLHVPFRLTSREDARFRKPSGAAAILRGVGRTRRARVAQGATKKLSKGVCARRRDVGRRPEPPGSGRGAPLGLVPGRQDARSGGRDRDGELEVRGQRSVLGVDRPAVVAHADL